MYGASEIKVSLYGGNNVVPIKFKKNRIKICIENLSNYRSITHFQSSKNG